MMPYVQAPLAIFSNSAASPSPLATMRVAALDVRSSSRDILVLAAVQIPFGRRVIAADRPRQSTKMPNES